MSAGAIVHVNEIGLMAAVEEGLEPELRDRPFAVGNEGAARAVILDLSPRAYAEGLRRGMPLAAARRLLPELETRAPRPELYRLADERLWRIALAYSPLVERAGAGHLYLDLAGTGRLFGPPEDAAQKLRRRILEETGLRPVIALASRKTAAKVATRVVRPAGFLALSAAEEGPLVARQPVELLPGVGTALRDRLILLGIEEIGALASLDRGEALALGPRGPFLADRARGLGDSPVNPEPPERRAARGEARLEPDSADPALLALRLRELAAELAFGLRREAQGCARASVVLVYADGLRGEGSSRANRPLARDDEILELALRALERARGRRVRVRALSLELDAIGPTDPGIDLFEPEGGRLDRLQAALDRVRGRYGAGGLRPCAALPCPGDAAAAASTVPVGAA